QRVRRHRLLLAQLADTEALEVDHLVLADDGDGDPRRIKVLQRLQEEGVNGLLINGLLRNGFGAWQEQDETEEGNEDTKHEVVPCKVAQPVVPRSMRSMASFRLRRIM